MKYEERERVVQKRAVVMIGCLALLYFATAGEPGADQKWIMAVQKILINGETTVSTPDAVKVDLLKQWERDHPPSDSTSHVP